MAAVDLRLAAEGKSWADAAMLLFAYHRETAVEVGAIAPDRPEKVWPPVRRETMDPASVYATYLIAYDDGRPVGGVALVAHDGLSVMLKRCFVPVSHRRRGVATALVGAARQLAADRGATRLVLDVLPSRTGAIAAWRRMGFVEAAPWGDPAMAYFELRTGDGRPPAWLGVPYGVVALRPSDRRWAEVFAHQAELLRRALADDVVAIEHVGSTAVLGLVAKPIIDVAVLVRPDVDIDAAVSSVTQAGYQFAGDKGAVGGRLFVLEHRPRRRMVHLHLLGTDDDQWERYLALRDRLRSDVEARRTYSAAKRELARRYRTDRGAYTAGKALVIAGLLEE